MQKKSKYLSWAEEKIDLENTSLVENSYNKGFVATRLGKGVMQKTRSVRIDLNKFSLSSENRRILKKTENLWIEMMVLPSEKYDFKVGKMAKDFYDQKSGKGTFSVQKIKEIITDKENGSFNRMINLYQRKDDGENIEIGHAICLETPNIIHYSYPFYDIEIAPKDSGLSMMLKTILYAKENKKKYFYIGSLQRTSDKYKLQFSGLEWFNGKSWTDNLELAKNTLSEIED